MLQDQPAAPNDIPVSEFQKLFVHWCMRQGVPLSALADDPLQDFWRPLLGQMPSQAGLKNIAANIEDEIQQGVCHFLPVISALVPS